MAEHNEDISMNGDAPTTQYEDARIEHEDTPLRTEEESSDAESDSDSDEEEETEWMVTTREKRSTAGNRLTSLIQQEEPDDELELLFAEDDDDAGFEDAEADQSDVQMDSSDDDDDQGPAAGADDLDGEKELQRAAKVEKAKKKRKLNDGIPVFKKRVKIDPTASQAPAPRPKKKSERASWIPAAEDLPTRASQRGTTKQQKRALHAQMVDRELKRLRQLENMEKAAAAKEAKKKPAMTQADRLREAARVEKANSKSLSRWEEAEQQREEEQRAKLAALSNRHLDGPVITWWSGLAEWVSGKLKQVGKSLVIEEPKEKPATKKRKLAEMEAESQAPPSDTRKPNGEAASATPGPATVLDPALKEASLPPGTGSLPQRSRSIDQASPPQPLQPETLPLDTDTTPLVPSPLQSSPQQTATPSAPMPLGESIPLQQNLPSTSLYSLPTIPQNNPPPTSAPPPPPAPSHPPFILAPPQPWNPNLPPPPPPRTSLDGSAPVPGLGFNPPSQLPRLMPSHTAPFQYSAPPTPQPVVPQPPAKETTSRNLVILANFDEVQVKDKNVQTQILFGRKFMKSSKPKPHSLCAITSQPARYRDPQTGLAYYNMYAYKEIQKLKRGEYKWSALVGAYVGPGTFAARGVPSRFLKGGERQQEAVLSCLH